MKFTIPANAAAKPFKKHWKFCVGSGHAALAMRTDYCEQLKQIHDDLGIERVRFHGIFSDDMHTYDTMATVMPMPGAEQIPFYESSFRLPGLVYDNVLKAGMKPFVELSFMPSQMAKRPTRGTFYWKPNIAPPKDEAQWKAHIQKFIRFLLNRYGKLVL
jgi:xylan 1,4-beta-xylosidase